MAFLIQGVFFQDRSALGIAYQPIVGATVVVRSGISQFMYAGAMWHDPDRGKAGELTGRMQDYFGCSYLADIVISDDKMNFTKTYEDERRVEHPIIYTFFVRDGNTWVGEYSSAEVGLGVTRCILTEVDDEFFLPESAMRLLSREKAHLWTGK